MKRLYIITLLLAATLILQAQTVTHAFRNTPLLEALQTIDREQTDYIIDILSDGLADLLVTADVKGMTVPQAVERICKDQPVKVKVKQRQITVQFDRKHKMRTIKLNGTINDTRAHNQLLGATVELLNADSICLQQQTATQRYLAVSNDGTSKEVERSEFSFTVPALPAKYIFRISLDGYQTAYVDYNLENIKHREDKRQLPPFYLRREVIQLPEVTVTASKVKFYYKGDTIIYNADAFVLAEGSMLDALISQLPGVTIDSNGRIYHDGKFVSDLLLNGKQFFSKDRKLLLENLPAYTVKDIAIYDKQTDENEFLGIKDERTQRHVIDVRLKKEYMTGWLANVEGGGGTHDRYLARLFALRFTDHSRFAVYANANNLDDASTPGEKDQWNRGSSNDLHTEQRAGVELFVEDRDKRWTSSSTITGKHSDISRQTVTNRQNFLPTGDTYDRAFTNKNNEDWQATAREFIVQTSSHLQVVYQANAEVNRYRHESDNTSATFAANVGDVSRNLIRNLYSPTTERPNLRDTLVNRILQQGKGDGHSFTANFSTSGVWKLNSANDRINFSTGFNYTGRTENSFNRQTVNYGAESTPAAYRHQYSQQKPYSDWDAYLNAQYTLQITKNNALGFKYTFRHKEQTHQQSLYALEALEQTDEQRQQPIDLLPSVTEYQQTMDYANSFDSHRRDNKHLISPSFSWNKKLKDKSSWWGSAALNLHLDEENLNYQRAQTDTIAKRLAKTFSANLLVVYNLSKGGQVTLNDNFWTSTPDLMSSIHIRDDADPMNIHLGNPSLRNSLTNKLTLHTYLPLRSGTHSAELVYTTTQRAQAVGYTYDTHTGVRTYRPDNVNGNFALDGSYGYSRSLMNKKLTLQGTAYYSYHNTADLVGVDGEAPVRSDVRHQSFSLHPAASYDFNGHRIALFTQVSFSRYTSDRATFTDFSAQTYQTGASGTFHLPWKFDLTTDLTLYARRGYVDDALNTSELVWNARLSRSILSGRLLFVLDGFDLLGQLSNITRTVNGQARTETYTNVLPRYALLHVVYRLNKQPKKK